MFTNPKENRTPPNSILIEEFSRKGYQCRQVKEEDATILYLTHGKKSVAQTNELPPDLANRTFKKFLGSN